MNDTEFQRLLATLRTTKLSPHERAMMRAEIQAYMRAHPARVPFLFRALDTLQYILQSSVMRPRFQLAAAALVAVFAIGGTTYAAEGSLPGNPLYAIKIHVNEPVQGAFAVSPEAKAQWSSQLAARRLEEAVTLAAQNKLDANASATLAAGVNQATEDFDSSIAELASSTNNVATVVDLQSAMEATLTVHAQVLSQIAQAVPGVHTAAAPILASVEHKVLAINGDQESLNARVTGNSEDVQQVALAQRDVALGQLGQAQALINANVHADTTESSSTPTDPDTAAAQAAIEVGQEHLAQGNYGAALATFQAATLAAHEAQVRTYVQSQIHGLRGVALPTTTIPVSIDIGADSTTTTTSAPSNGDSSSSQQSTSSGDTQEGIKMRLDL